MKPAKRMLMEGFRAVLLHNLSPGHTLSTAERSDMRRDERLLMAGWKLHSRTSSAACSRRRAANRSCAPQFLGFRV